MKVQWSREEIDLLSSVYATKPKKEIKELFPNRTWIALKNKATKLGLLLSRVNNVGDLSILLNGSLVSSYWLGFICADGHLTDTTLFLEISEKDKEHLLKLGMYINFKESSLYNRTRTIFTGSYSMCSLIVSHKKVIDQLKIRYNITQRKTKNPISLVSLNDLQKLSFFIGFIDGDGCISNQNNPMLSLEIDASWFTILQQFEQLLNKLNFNAEAKALLYTRKDTGQVLSRFQTRNKTTLKQLKYFAEKTNLPIMRRKWDNI